MEKKVTVVINGHAQRLSPAALKLAKRLWGAEKLPVDIKNKPIELLKLPDKKDIIKAKPVENAVEKPVIKARRKPAKKKQNVGTGK